MKNDCTEHKVCSGHDFVDYFDSEEKCIIGQKYNITNSLTQNFKSCQINWYKIFKNLHKQ